MKPIIKMSGITKTFYGGEKPVIANNNVELSVLKGEIHAIVGENGAGKSTLMNILYGLIQPDKGIITIKDREVQVNNPRIAISLGIGMVHQQFMLVPSFSITENVILGNEIKKFGFIDRSAANQKVSEISKRHSLYVDPTKKIQDCPVGIQQRAEILKILYRGADVIILDEPTAVLTPQETQDLFEALRNLSKNGASIIFITHKLQEVMEISDNVTVMRDGKVVANLKTKETNEKELARYMIGRDLVFKFPKQKVNHKKILLDVKKISILGDTGTPAVSDLSFQVRCGEIVGIAGVAGNGQEELIEALMGQREIKKGEIFLDGNNVTKYTTRDIRLEGCGFIPEDRNKKGCCGEESLTRNLIMGKHWCPPIANKFWINLNEADTYATELINSYDIQTSDKDLPISNLSGGNVQKSIVGRELALARKILIAEQPTRGIDVGATEFVHNQIIRLRDLGIAILLVSTELSEILQLSTRILVIYKGRITGERNPALISEEELGLLMAGIDH